VDRTKTHAFMLVFLSRLKPCSGGASGPPSFTIAEASSLTCGVVLRYRASRGDLDCAKADTGVKDDRREGEMVFDKLRLWRTERRRTVERRDIYLSARSLLLDELDTYSVWTRQYRQWVWKDKRYK
jgi:hypothetical protein